jgi:catalase
LAGQVAEKLGVTPLPKAATPAKAPNKNLPASDALSIIKNSPQTFDGRKLGALVTDGVDEKLLTALRKALKKEGASLELVAPRVAGIAGSDGTRFDADHMIAGGPSVLFDAVVLLPSATAAAQLALVPEARDFVADAYAHCKFIGCGEHARPMLECAGVEADEGVLALSNPASIARFVERCRELRFFARRRTA